MGQRQQQVSLEEQFLRKKGGNDELSRSATFKMGSQVSVDTGAVHVVIVGGGFGGIAAASQLQALNVPFMLVDMKDSFHHNVAALRASVESGFARKTFISYSVTFKDNFRQGKVIGIDLKNRMVLLQGGEALPFSHLILATGSTGSFPGKFNEVSCQQAAIQAYEDMVKQIQRSQFIVVVGGGSAGVEMAAEIKTEYPEKEVTLIHSRVPLADKELLPCVRQEVKEILLRKGVQLLLSERVSNLEELPRNEYREYIKVETDKGTEVATNLVIVCNGIKINSSAYRSAFGEPSPAVPSPTPSLEARIPRGECFPLAGREMGTGFREVSMACLFLVLSLRKPRSGFSPTTGIPCSLQIQIHWATSFRTSFWGSRDLNVSTHLLTFSS
ncbi:ferroptosis suppressor protein 1 isoform X2 [Apodemus sylvaticus]|uniref:ferroptosis suppressor protein 1 isoform X2 n=1 Tax=Apodemus sylvaticus TaxID=10129 RepID=UPI002244A301|nr:ferroptosis suppressor protein 1 isoform X2 [Apodemus sylvaticus]